MRKSWKRIREIWEARRFTSLINSPNFRFVTTFPPGHYGSPLPDIDSLSEDLFVRAETHLEGIELNAEAQLRLVTEFASLATDFPFPANQTQGFRYFYENRFFIYGDALALFCFLRKLRPKRVIEIGSGFSSALMLDTADKFLAERPHFTFIEPHPERLHTLIGSHTSAEILETVVQSVDPAVFRDLEENDILFVDSSHVSKVGSDVNHIFFKILPLLKPGVLVHIHDIVWPFEYPEQWIRQGRAWNEAYLLRAFLQFNHSFEIVFFNSFLAHVASQAIGLLGPKFREAPGGSLWLRRTR